MTDSEQSATGLENPAIDEELDGLDVESKQWGGYPLDDLWIRQENRTVLEVIRRIERGSYVMNPDFQRDFIWPEDKQSKLIESVVMRIPLPVFYLAEDEEGRMIVVDGLQRLSTLHRFMHGELRLRLPDRRELDRLRFSDLPPRFMNRIEDCNLILYVIECKTKEQVRLEIFERVNSGAPLSRQQMRNALFPGPATRLLKEASRTASFLAATGSSLDTRSMRDREFVNRFCAFRLLGLDDYHGDMDDFLARSLRRMNDMAQDDLTRLADEFLRSMEHNHLLFGRHAFSRSFLPAYKKAGSARLVLNASIWDVMSTGLAAYDRDLVKRSAADLRASFSRLLQDEEFVTAITYGTNDAERVRKRFHLAGRMFQEVLGAI